MALPKLGENTVRGNVKVQCWCRTKYKIRPGIIAIISFLSHFGESWNLCSLVGVGIN